MAPGWLDIHGHFFLPQTAAEDVEFVKASHAAHFMISEAPQFKPDKMLAYNDAAGVGMQMLSYIPLTTRKLQQANDFGLSIVQKYPSRFGLLAALPTDEPGEALKEIGRMRSQLLQADGFAVTTMRGGIGLGHESLRPVWAELNKRGEVIFVHPNAYLKGQDGRPSPLIDVAFDTARTITDMIYSRVFLDFPEIKWVFSHCAGAFPALSGRVLLLGTESWVPNHKGIKTDDIKKQISSIYVDTAASAETGMEPAVRMVGIEHVVYGADCGVPCSTERTMEENKEAVRMIAKKYGDSEQVGMNGFKLFPYAEMRAQS
ncbi:unnamed protein product [Clonostachys chloroleuca]|uniref:6-methylsalicylate decarboxylase n=1 Tax=Clonostachys chloroleuca TaxID=1926264 RepID=A0AA35LSI6_9HYPO|nr:unnamed protein product [Clonostachys chloroleuca]